MPTPFIHPYSAFPSLLLIFKCCLFHFFFFSGSCPTLIPSHVIFKRSNLSPCFQIFFSLCKTSNIPVLHSIPIPHRTPTKMMNHLPPMEKIQLLSFAVIPRTVVLRRTVRKSFADVLVDERSSNSNPGSSSCHVALSCTFIAFL